VAVDTKLIALFFFQHLGPLLHLMGILVVLLFSEVFLNLAQVQQFS
jgi:hypothetical protein